MRIPVSRAVLRLTVATAGLMLALVAAEIATRYLDGYRLTGASLVQIKTAAAATHLARTPLEHHLLATVPTAAGVDRAWYDRDPEPVAAQPLSPERQARVDRYPTDIYGALFEWNQNYLREMLCAGYAGGSLGILEDFHYFAPASGEVRPTYRHLRNIWRPNWMVANSFGWRGPDVALNKPPDTIRLAFVGASTTVSAYGYPFSHPEYIGYWLNLWAQAQGHRVRFEVINGGRTGIDSSSISAIVRDEIAPVEADLVIYYEGANQFWPGTVLDLPKGDKALTAPTSTFPPPTWLERHSAIARRVVTAGNLIAGRSGLEPVKPDFPARWAEGLNLSDPDLDAPGLPSNLPAILADLDSMRRALAPAGGELAVSSFIWMVQDGMRLDPDRHQTLYQYLNDTYWPTTYAVMRQLADLQNTVFRKYAARHQLEFFDVAADFPQDPDLFGDAIHMRPQGLRLLAWIYLQKLIPLLEARIQSGALPRPMMTPRTEHPAFAVKTGLMSRAEVMASCPKP